VFLRAAVSAEKKHDNFFKPFSWEKGSVRPFPVPIGPTADPSSDGRDGARGLAFFSAAAQGDTSVPARALNAIAVPKQHGSPLARRGQWATGSVAVIIVGHGSSPLSPEIESCNVIGDNDGSSRFRTRPEVTLGRGFFLEAQAAPPHSVAFFAIHDSSADNL